MADSREAPTTDQLLLEASSSVGTRHRIVFQGMEFEFHLQADRILVYCADENTPVAVIRFGSPFSGAIWMRGQLVGEYDKDRDGKFVVTEIESGFKQPDSRRQQDPVEHVLNQLQPA